MLSNRIVFVKEDIAFVFVDPLSNTNGDFVNIKSFATK